MTVLFCDMVDWTNLTRQTDQEDLRSIIRGFQDVCASVINRYEGRISRFMGDGILTLFGYPIAHDDDAYRAVKTGIEIIDRLKHFQADKIQESVEISVRIGISTGLVIAGDLIGEHAAQEHAIVGETPNLAARLQSLAEPNSIRISHSTYRLVQERMTCQSLGFHAVKGYPDPIEIFNPISESPDYVKVKMSSTGSLSPFMGRIIEIGELEACWQSAQAFHGQTVFITGEPGIGKSRLIHEALLSLKKEKSLILECGCSPYLKNSALYPIFEMFARWFNISPDDQEATIKEKIQTAVGQKLQFENTSSIISSLLFIAQQSEKHSNVIGVQFSIVHPLGAVRDILLSASKDRPIILVIEDLHWSDPTTLKLMTSIAHQIENKQILVMITSRKEEQLDNLGLPSSHHIKLNRLNNEDTSTIIANQAGDAPFSDKLRQEIAARSDGVPLFIEELTTTIKQNLASDHQDKNQEPDRQYIPETLRDSLMARLDALETAKPLAQLASAIGRDFSYEFLKNIASLDHEVLDLKIKKMVDSEIVYQDGHLPNATFRFKHSLIRDVAYDSLLHSKQREFHIRIAKMLEAKYAETTVAHPELLARHYKLGNRPTKSVEYWREAGVQALQRSANVEALNHCRNGLRELEKLKPEQKNDRAALSLYLTLGFALSHTEGYGVPEVDEAFSKSLEICNRLGSQDDMMSVIRGLHMFYVLSGPLHRATELADQFVQVAQNSNDPGALCGAKRTAGWTAFCRGEMVQGHKLLTASLELYEANEDTPHLREDAPYTGAICYTNFAWVSWFLGHVDDAILHSERAISLARVSDNTIAIGYALCMGGAVYQSLQQPTKVQLLVDEAIAIASEQDARYWGAWATCLKGWSLAAGGDTSVGMQVIEEGIAKYNSAGAKLFVSHIQGLLAESLFKTNKPELARKQLTEALLADEKLGIGFFRAENQRLLAEACWKMGDKPQARIYLDNARQTAVSQRADSIKFKVNATLNSWATNQAKLDFS